MKIVKCGSVTATVLDRIAGLESIPKSQHCAIFRLYPQEQSPCGSPCFLPCLSIRSFFTDLLGRSSKTQIRFELLSKTLSCLYLNLEWNLNFWCLPIFPASSPPRPPRLSHIRSPPAPLVFFLFPKHYKVTVSLGSWFNIFSDGNISPRSCCGWLCLVIQISVHVSSSQRDLFWPLCWLKKLPWNTAMNPFFYPASFMFKGLITFLNLFQIHLSVLLPIHASIHASTHPSII